MLQFDLKMHGRIGTKTQKCEWPRGNFSFFSIYEFPVIFRLLNVVERAFISSSKHEESSRKESHSIVQPSVTVEMSLKLKVSEVFLKKIKQKFRLHPKIRAISCSLQLQFGEMQKWTVSMCQQKLSRISD